MSRVIGRSMQIAFSKMSAGPHQFQLSGYVWPLVVVQCTNLSVSAGRGKLQTRLSLTP